MTARFPWTEMKFSMTLSRFQLLSCSAQRYVIKAVFSGRGSGEDSGATRDRKPIPNPILKQGREETLHCDQRLPKFPR